MEWLLAALEGFWLFLPAYVANPAAVLTGHGTPVDFGIKIGGRRVFGDGKTWYGLFGGTISGMFIGLLQLLISLVVPGIPSHGAGIQALFVIFLLSFGALFGDLLGSFMKRRMGIERGNKAPLLDQYDFVIGTIVLLSIFSPSFLYSHYFRGVHIAGLVTIIVVTPPLHRAVNILGYKLGEKEVPW